MKRPHGEGFDQPRDYTVDELEVFNLLQQPVWIFEWGSSQKIVWANTSSLTVWNAASLEELLARDLSNSMSTTEKARMKEELSRLNCGETRSEYQWTVFPEGSPTKVPTTISPLHMEGKLLFLVEMEIPTNLVLNNASDRTEEILRCMPIAVSQYDADGKLVYQNPEALNTFGGQGETDSSDFEGRFVDREMGRKVLQMVASEGDQAHEVQLYTTDNSRKHFRVTVHKTTDPGGGAVVLWTAREMSEIIQAREDTRKARIKSDLIAVVSHQIRTPLHHIVGHMDLIESSGLTPNQADLVKSAQRSCSLLISVTNDLSDYADLENGRVRLEVSPFKPADVIKACIMSATKTAYEKGLNVVESCVGLPDVLVGDADRLRQILFNLLDNSVKRTKQGSVSLAASVVLGTSNTCRVRFRISDTGVGIRKQHHARIFQKYELAADQPGFNYGGAGLGLSLAERLTEAMGGEMSLQNTEGEETVVQLEIPFALPQNIQSGPAKIPESGPQIAVGEGRNILVVEDNVVNQKMITRMLQRLGHKAYVAENGQVGVDTVQTNKFDLVLMDVCMPLMDGIDATKRIRELGFNKMTLPIVGLTASFQMSELGYYSDIGMNHCIGKPANLNALREVIETFAVASKPAKNEAVDT